MEVQSNLQYAKNLRHPEYLQQAVPTGYRLRQGQFLPGRRLTSNKFHTRQDSMLDFQRYIQFRFPDRL